MTSLQRQAVLVCVVCALAALLTVGITLTLLKRGKPETPGTPADSVPTDTTGDGESTDLANHYQIDNTSSALLTETADAGTEYLDNTLFLGDSNTVRLYNNGLISLQQFCAKEGIGTQVALNEGIITFKNDTTHYTIAQAVAKMKPRRVVMTFGTNDTGMEVADFISNYTALVQAIQEAYPYTDLIVNTVPPIPENHSNYPHMDQAKIDDFNMALLNMCEQLGVRFLNTAEVLKGENGYGQPDYYTDGDIHLKSAGLKAALSYLRTHAYQTEDRRPDTNNIPTRTLEYVSNPSSAVQAPSSEEPASSSESESVSSSETASVKFEARYQVEKSGGGTLSCGNESGKTSLTYGITDASQSLTVTATPAEGHVFVKWSDGVTQKTRTDTNFKQNVDVTAVFAAASVHISSTGKAVLGDSYTFTAKLGGKHLTADSIRWYANGAEVPQAAGKTTVKVEIDPSMLNATFKVYAVASYNGCTVTSNVLNVTVSGVSSGSSSHSSGSSGSSGSTSGSSSSGSTSSSGASSGTTSGASSGATSTSGSSSHSSSDSSSHSSSSSESTASPAGSASASNGTASSSHSTSSSHADSGESSSASHSSSSSESSSASSGSSHAASESNASKEAANEQSASTDSAS